MKCIGCNLQKKAANCIQCKQLAESKLTVIEKKVMDIKREFDEAIIIADGTDMTGKVFAKLTEMKNLFVEAEE